MRLRTTIIAAGLLASASVLTAPPANALITFNGLFANGLFTNGLWVNGIPMNGMNLGNAIAALVNELDANSLIVREVALPDD